ncbi:hypothetical protein D3C86_1282820 [compost metagenome]
MLVDEVDILVGSIHSECKLDFLQWSSFRSVFPDLFLQLMRFFFQVAIDRFFMSAHRKIVIFNQIFRFSNNVPLLLHDILLYLFKIVLVGEVENKRKDQQYGNKNIHQQLPQDCPFSFHEVKVWK